MKITRQNGKGEEMILCKEGKTHRESGN